MIYRTQTNNQELFELAQALSLVPRIAEFRTKVSANSILAKYGEGGGMTLPPMQRALLRIGIDARKAQCTEIDLVLGQA